MYEFANFKELGIMEILLHNQLKLYTATKISESCARLNLSCKVEQAYDDLSVPIESGHGHLAFKVFNLAKVNKFSIERMTHNLGKDLLKYNSKFRIQILGPYVNFVFSAQLLGEFIGEKIINEEIFQYELILDAPKTMIEYSQPNTHKELHVGHLRNLCLGDALVNIHRYCGYSVISSTFPGDIGTHVAKCLWFIKKFNLSPREGDNFGQWLGKVYSQSHNMIEVAKDEDKAKIANELSDILSSIAQGTGEYYELWQKTRSWSIEQMEKLYEWANVTFDKWYWESEVDLPSVEYVKSLLGNGIVIQSNGVIGVDLSSQGLGFCVLIKSDGLGLYATKDVELARRKFEEFDIEKSIYIVDKRQAHHFKQIFAVLSMLGFENASNCFHLAYDYVELPSGAMSSRAGNILPVFELINAMYENIKKTILNKKDSSDDTQGLESISHIVALGAIKYGMLKSDPGRKIVFDINEWLNIEGESGVYIQYTAVRLKSVLNKVSIGENPNPSWRLLELDLEQRILVKLSEFNEKVVTACLAYKPNLLSLYIYELCRLVNNYYNTVSLKNTHDDDLRIVRSYLINAVYKTVKKGSELLGIPIPERM